MRRHVVVVWATAVAGLALGAAWGELGRTPLWPKLSDMVLQLRCAVGWLIGLALGIVLAWLRSRRAPASSPKAPRRASAGPGIAAVAALAPAVLWFSAALPGSAMRNALTMYGRHGGDRRPNLIYITVDALRADHLGAYGSRAGLTPVMDAFAAQATTYEAAYAEAPWTMASFASIWTLLPPSQCDLKATPEEGEGWYWKRARLGSDIPVLPGRLREAGYVTAAELTNPFLMDTRGWVRGFDFFHHEPIPEGMAPDTTPGVQVTEGALAWLKRNRGEPFFLWTHYLDPHAPYDAPTTPPELRARYPKWRAGEREVWAARKQSDDKKSIARYQEYCRAMYAEEVRYADQCVGELLAGIKAAGLWDRSLIVISADHGEELFDHGGVDHGHTMHEELLHVPLLVKWPAGVSADRRVAQTVELPSLAATFLEVAGVDVNDRGAAPPLPRRNGERGQAVYSEAPLYGAEQTALTTDRWRVIYHPTEPSRERQFEVYDRRSDRAEQHDEAATGAAADLRARLRQDTEQARLAVARRAAQGAPESAPLTEDAKRQLRALGYMK
jgi:arylsulfatase A-like enzyme